MFNFCLLTAAAGQEISMWPMLLITVGMLVVMFIFTSRSQKKEQKKAEELANSLAIGDSVLTSGGFYGTIVDVVDENVVVVEFGGNKNCRIFMKKRAIVEVEKPETAENK